MPLGPVQLQGPRRGVFVMSDEPLQARFEIDVPNRLFPEAVQTR